MQSGLALIAHNVGELKAHLTSMEGHVMSSEDDKQEDKSPLELNQWEETPPDPYPATDRGSKYDQLSSRLTQVQQFTSARSAHFQQTDEQSPSEDNDRREPIVEDRSHVVRSDSTELVDNSWITCIKALLMSLDEAEHMKSVQSNKQKEILMNFLRTAHIYKPSDGCQIQ